jgi:hypothetical protein
MAPATVPGDRNSNNNNKLQIIDKKKWDIGPRLLTD